MASAEIATDTVKFHLSLNCSNLVRSVAFYRALFGCEPAKVKSDYAKFELGEPPVILSLVPVSPSQGGTLNHVGLRLLDSAALVAVQARLEAAGHRTEREEGVECCYSKQTKFWVTDPDRTLWEIYHLLDDEDDHAEPTTAHAPSTVIALQSLLGSSPLPPVVWHHMLTQPLPARIEHADASVDEVGLQGTLNMAIDDAQRQAFLREAFRVLKPGGVVTSHHLTADRAVVDRPQLPGPAALVERVLVESTGVDDLAAAGFVQIEFTKLGESPCFCLGNVQMRETKLRAIKPGVVSCDRFEVLYRGPLARVCDDYGNTFVRGRRSSIPREAAQALRQSTLADQFTFFPGSAEMPGSASQPGSTQGSCCS